jgi:hypothetical protein
MICKIVPKLIIETTYWHIECVNRIIKRLPLRWLLDFGMAYLN